MTSLLATGCLFAAVHNILLHKYIINKQSAEQGGEWRSGCEPERHISVVISLMFGLTLSHKCKITSLYCEIVHRAIRAFSTLRKIH